MEENNNQQTNDNFLEPELIQKIISEQEKSKNIKKAEDQKKKAPKVIFQTNGSFTLIDETGKEIENGEAQFILDEEKLSLILKNGKAFTFFLRDISDFFAQDYKIYLSLSGGEKAVISNLGYQYDDFARVFSKLRQEIIKTELLMEEKVRKSGLEGDYDYEENGKRRFGKAEVEICDTGLIVKPEQGDLIRIPYSEIIEFKDENYQISIKTEFSFLILSHFGEKFDILDKVLKEAIAELSLKTQAILKEILPELDPLSLQKAAELLKDGRAVEKNELDKISSGIWQGLEKELIKIGIKEYYDYLKALSKSDQIFIGIKRDLMGDLTGEYLWFLMPISSNKGENFLVMEAGSTIESGGKATYLFKVPEGEELNDLVKKFNRCMLEINFRREPIYLKEEDLEKPEYLKYKIAISKIPELRLLRQLFVGRVIHTSTQSWKENLDSFIS